MMVRGFGMSLLYHGPHRKPEFESTVGGAHTRELPGGTTRTVCDYAPDVRDLLQTADVVSLHPPLNESSLHLINAERLSLMKPDAILVNVSRGPVIDEAALVDHCRTHPQFRVGLDVFENEPELVPGLSDLPNVVLAPHIGSASTWARESMSLLAAYNIVGVLNDRPVWQGEDFVAFLTDPAPTEIPSFVNPEVLATR